MPQKCWVLISVFLGLVPIAAYSASGEVAPLAPGKPSCDWLQEVKRTNTWLERDQNGRIAFMNLLNKQKQLEGAVTDQQVEAAKEAVRAEDQTLQGELDDLVARCGWPTTSGYGEKATLYAAFIVQHADLPYQEKYLPMMQAAADAKELKPGLVAMLVDRVLVRKGLPQRYGTQLHKNDGKSVVYPIEDPEHVDERRAAVDLIPASFCVYIAMFDSPPQSDLCKAF